jgi:hypothetical protein
MACSRGQTVRFACITSLRLEGKQTHILCKLKTISTQELRQRATKYCRWEIMFVQDDRKVTQPIPDTCSICQKIKYIEIRKQKNNIILSVGNVHRVQRCMHSLFSSCLMQPGEDFLCHGNGLPDEILSICLTQKNREMYLQTHSGKLSKNEMPGSVRQ